MNNVSVTPSSGHYFTYNGSSWTSQGIWPSDLKGGSGIDISDMNDVSGSTPSSGDVLAWNGTQWAPTPSFTGGGGSTKALEDNLEEINASLKEDIQQLMKQNEKQQEQINQLQDLVNQLLAAQNPNVSNESSVQAGKKKK